MTNINSWIEESGLDNICRPDVDLIRNALAWENFPENISDEDVRALDQTLSILSNYYLYLKYQCGLAKARMCYLIDKKRNGEPIVEDDIIDEKTKFNILEPTLEGIKNKIDGLRKIYDGLLRKSYELRNIRS